MRARTQLRRRKPTRRLSLFCTVVLYALEESTSIDTTVQEGYIYGRFWQATWVGAVVSQARNKTRKISHSSWSSGGPKVFKCRSSGRLSAFWIERMHGARAPKLSPIGIVRSSLCTADDTQAKLHCGTRSTFYLFIFWFWNSIDLFSNHFLSCWPQRLENIFPSNSLIFSFWKFFAYMRDGPTKHRSE
jgi:hypothetical protein